MIKKRIGCSITSLLEYWTRAIPYPETEDGVDLPLMFQDDLALILFHANLCRIMMEYYTIGRKHERKKRSRRERFKFINEVKI
jgi:hypothetical protein